MNTPQDSQLGRETSYPAHYDPGLLFPIPRSAAREQIGLRDGALPFVGFDRWQAYELGWLDARGKPQVGVATFTVPCTSPNLIESKSFKLYLNSLNDARFDSADALRERIVADLSARAGAQVEMGFGLPPLADAAPGKSLDAQELEFTGFDAPQPELLSADANRVVAETLSTELFKSNCPVTGQPDWASIVIQYRGPQLEPAGLLRYLLSFRHHAEFHEQCVERVFSEILARCNPHALSVEARYTRRGGLDINPWRATPGFAKPTPARELRQ